MSVHYLLSTMHVFSHLWMTGKWGLGGMNIIYGSFSSLGFFHSLQKKYPMKNCDTNWAFPEISGYVKNWCVFVMYYVTLFPSEEHFNQCMVKSTDFLSTRQKGSLVWFILQSMWMTFCLLKHRIHWQGHYNSSKKVLKPTW